MLLVLIGFAFPGIRGQQSGRLSSNWYLPRQPSGRWWTSPSPPARPRTPLPNRLPAWVSLPSHCPVRAWLLQNPRHNLHNNPDHLDHYYCCLISLLFLMFEGREDWISRQRRGREGKISSGIHFVKFHNFVPPLILLFSFKNGPLLAIFSHNSTTLLCFTVHTIPLGNTVLHLVGLTT